MDNNKFEFEKFQNQIFKLCKRKQFDDARTFCQEALAKCNEDSLRAAVYKKISYIENAAGNGLDGISALKKARELDPRSRGVLHALMCDFIVMRQYEESIEVATDLISLDTEFPIQSFTSSAYLHKAYACCCLERYNEAEVALQACDYEESTWIGGGMLSKSQLFSNILNRRPPQFAPK